MTVGRARTSPRQRTPSPRRGRLGTQGGRAAFLATGPTAWYDARDLTSTAQTTLTNRVGTGSATLTAGAIALPHTGTNYCYLPSTASNNLSIPKDGGWAGTLHVTGTLTDDTTATFTTTASPILIGNTLIAAGRYKRFDVRDTDGNGTLRVTINLAVETLGQATWTCTTGQTVTVNRSTTGLTTAIVSRPLVMLDGTDDYLQLPAGDTPTFTKTTGKYAFLNLFRDHNAPAGSADLLFDARSAALEGIAQHLLTTNVARTTVYGTSQVLSDAGSSLANSTIRGVGGVVNEGTVATYVGGVGLATPQSITGLTIQPSFAAPRVGSPAYTVATTADMELFATVIWNSDTAKTSAELTTVYTFLSGNYT